MDEHDTMATRVRECQNIVEQYRDAGAMHEAGAISDEVYCERQGKYNACLRVLALVEGGDEVSDEQFAEIIAEEIESAAQPSKYELLRADVDYALMLGGEL